MLSSNTTDTQLSDLTKRSFEQEFSSLIIKSTVSSTASLILNNSENKIKFSDQIELISSSIPSKTSSFSSKYVKMTSKLD